MHTMYTLYIFIYQLLIRNLQAGGQGFQGGGGA